MPATERRVRPRPVKIGFRGRAGFRRAACCVFGGGIGDVVFNGGKAPATVKDGNTDPFVRPEEFREILHHRFKPGRLLESSPRAVRILRVHELGDNALRAFENTCVGSHLDDQDVDVAGKKGEAVLVGDIALRADGRTEQRVELVVFHVDHEFLAVADQPGQPADRFAGNAVDGEGVEVEPFFDRDAEGGGHGIENLSVGVLNKNEMFDTLLLEPSGDSAGVQQHVDVAVPMRLEDELVFFLQRKVSLVVGDGRNEFLLENVNLLFLQAEPVVGFERGERFCIGVLGSHDDQGHGTRDVHAGFHGLETGGVMRDVRRRLRHFHRDVELDARIAQPFAEPARHQHECGFEKMGFAQSFIAIVAGVELRQIDGIRLMRDEPFKWIGAFPGFVEQCSRIRDITE